MNEVITLIGNAGERDVFCRLEYENEQLLEYDGQRYHVLRTYRNGQELEITVARASAEEGGIYG